MDADIFRTSKGGGSKGLGEILPEPLGQILELPAETCTEFSNECRWTGGERLYSIRSAENIFAYGK